ncbi:MAG TPA: antibiotic biosynthesis monooxygenase, partial [Streptosporangiaceae bacterium]|nr:antibiotic biosynthesis monooxygenase [Streptosporangiaceae bacterium]
MTELISIATATAHPDHAGDLIRELQARTGPTRLQPGNLDFILYQQADAPATIVAYERWASRADWERHLQGEHVTSLMTVFEAILAEPPQITVLAPLPDQAAPAAVVRAYLGAWQDHDFPAMRRLVADGLRFTGPLDTFDQADAHHAAIKALSEGVDRIEINRLWSDGPDVLAWYTLHTTISAPAP